MIQELNGSFVALVTPMESDGAIDYASLDRLIDWHIDQGTNGIVSVGTTGESATVNLSEHIDLIQHTVKHVNKRVPVIAGTGANSTLEAVELTKEAERIGADFALIVTPYYNKPSQNGLIQHYTKIADCSNIPQILYNVPSRTSCDLIPQTVNVLSEHKNIIGIKEAVNDKKRINDLIKISLDNQNFKILSGDDPSFYEFLKCGGHGVISVAANVIPESISKICSYTSNGDEAGAKILNDRYINLYEMLFFESNPIPVKWMLNKMGFIKNSLRLPLNELDKKYHESISAEMLKLGLI
jgi:4-hydroxy-tetrahydrodipicolinate synthase